MLVARLACTGRVSHKAKGYSGPLSRHLLAYYSIVAAVRASIRDLLDMCLATMFMEGDCEREREKANENSLKAGDWMELKLR